MSRSALVIGATGLVGEHLVKLMLRSSYYQRIVIVTRKSLNLQDDRFEEIIIENFDDLPKYASQVDVQDYFCALGTTMKKAGSKAQFEKVDLEYPMQLAQIARSSENCRQFLVVTAAGSNSSSPLFYNKVKGKLEDQLKELGLPAVKIFRPSLLLGDRSEHRLGERIAKGIAKILSFLMVGLHSGLLAIEASDVAYAMILIARQSAPGIQVFKSNHMIKLAKTQGL